MEPVSSHTTPSCCDAERCVPVTLTSDPRFSIELITMEGTIFSIEILEWSQAHSRSMLLVLHVGIFSGQPRPQEADIGGTRETLSYAACWRPQVQVPFAVEEVASQPVERLISILTNVNITTGIVTEYDTLKYC